MNILADSALTGVQQAFARFGTVTTVPGRSITPALLADTEVLLLRSVTRVDRALLAAAPRLRFVGTATSGIDHLDTAALDAAGIRWASAPGCNAPAVAEYVACALALLSARSGEALAGKTLGILGFGHTGSRVAALAAELGMAVCWHDPWVDDARYPRVANPEALLDADVLSLHVPLVRAGAHPTQHWLDARRIARLKPGAWLVNACRGAVVDNRALYAALAQGQRLTSVLDVWEGEPQPDAGLLEQVALATPHIAGYGRAARERGLAMVHEAFCAWQGVPPDWQAPAGPLAGQLPFPAGADPVALLCRITDLPGLDRQFRTAMQEADRAAAFDRCRREAANRAGFGDWQLACERSADAERLARLGFASGVLA